MTDVGKPIIAPLLWRLKDWLLRSHWVIYILGFIPAVAAFYAGMTGGLGADPIREFEHFLGQWALRFLILTLLVTPIRHLLGYNLLRYRRALGLMTFYYALMHFLVYMILDRRLALATVIEDIINRPFITIGMAGLFLLLLLAITSNHYFIRKLGSNWIRLHKLVYVVAILGVVHFLMSVKSWPAEPIVYAAIIAVLLAFRPLRRLLPKAGAKRPNVASVMDRR